MRGSTRRRHAGLDPMLVGLSDDQEFFRARRALLGGTGAARRPPPAARRPGRVRPGLLATRRRAGWTSLLVREEHGGGTISGAGLVDLSLVAYEFGRHAAPGPLLATNVVASTLSAQRRRPRSCWPACCRARSIASWCAPRCGTRRAGSRRCEARGRVRPRAARRGPPGGVGRQADHLLVTVSRRSRSSPRCSCRRTRRASQCARCRRST